MEPRRRDLLTLLADLEALTLRLGSTLDIPGEHRLELLKAARRAQVLLSLDTGTDGHARSWLILHGDAAGTGG